MRRMALGIGAALMAVSGAWAQKPTIAQQDPRAAIFVQRGCNACHGIMDPLGFALENFDAVGKWRNVDRASLTPIDAGGRLASGQQVKGPADLRTALASRPDQFVQTFTSKLLMFALGRTVEYHDMPAVRAIVRGAAQDNYRFESIIMGIVNSDAFQMRQNPVTNP